MGTTLPPKVVPTVEEKYRLWITEHYPTRLRALAACSSATQGMVEAFPELKRVRGYFCFQDGGGAAHWWCETEDGRVVDPTALQFGAAPGEYQALDESYCDPYPGEGPKSECQLLAESEMRATYEAFK